MRPIVDNFIRRQQRREENQVLRIERRLIREQSRLFDIPDDRFIELFRLNKEAAHELVDSLLPFLRHSRYLNSVPPELKIFSTLIFYATGSYQRSVGRDFNIGLSQTIVHRCIHEVTEAINEHLTPIKIRFPVERMEMIRNKEKFMEKFQFPGVLAAIDCTHIAILKPNEEEHAFVNRKGYHSLNVQLICDADLKILGINSNFPGSNHDSFIWRQSQIRDFLLQNFRNGIRRTWLIGDSGYPLEPILLTPFLNPTEGSPEAAYNVGHIRARNCIERCIGVLKMRFRCSIKERTARYTPNFMGKVVNSCAVLHNICLSHNVNYEYELHNDVELVRNENSRGNDNNLLAEGREVRRNVVEDYFNV